MEKITLGKTNIEVSRVGFGVLPVGPGQLNLSLEKAGEIISYAFSKGINFIDTAQYYHTYPHIAHSLKANPGFEPVICSKCLGTSYNEMQNAIEEARLSLNRDVIDIFLMHEVRSGQLPLRQGAWECLNDAKAKGIVKAIGMSTHHVDIVEEASHIEECDVVFPLINYAGLGVRLGNHFGTARQMLSAIEKCYEKDMGIFSMKVFGGGNLTTHYQQALDYVFSKQAIQSVMIGFGKTSEIDDICSYLDGSMAKAYNPDTSLKTVHVDQGDCEGCGACMKVCASKAIFYNENGLAQIDDSRCITCGYCSFSCPVRAIIMY